MNYPVMANDLLELLDAAGMPRVHVIGHSMGGKAAMQLALTNPGQVRSLVVVDIAPKQYERKHDVILNALLRADLSGATNRREVETALEPAIPELAVRRFLLKNAVASAGGGFHWRMGIKQIADNYGNLGEAIHAPGPYTGPTLFLRGANSNYLTPDDEHGIRTLFPAASFATIPRAGHWVHVDNPSAFQQVVVPFIKNAVTSG